MTIKSPWHKPAADEVSLHEGREVVKRPAGTIDITPSWKQAAEAILLAMEHGTPEGKKIAREELRRMAEVADAYVAEHPEMRK